MASKRFLPPVTPPLAVKGGLLLLWILLKFLTRGGAPEPDPEPEPEPEPTEPECKGTAHTVQPGESLWGIANQYGITIERLLAENPQITNPDLIHVGQVICIPIRRKKMSLSYLFGATSNQYLDMLSKTNDSLNAICPDYFEIDGNGGLLPAGPNKLNAPFIEAVHGQGIFVIPFITNHFNRELGVTALNNRDRLTDQLAEAVQKYGLDGVDIDIENVSHEHRDMYTDFARLLRQKLPEDKIVSSAVAANPRGFTSGWHGSYDYSSLSRYCDYLFIMSYDEHYFGSAEGPVSSADFFERSIQYALNQGVAKDKLVSGLPFFGRYWKKGEATGGYGLTGKNVEFLAANYETTLRFDEAAQSANAIVTIKPGEQEPVVLGGRRLTAGSYSIWYDSPEATKFKLRTINRYDLLGAGSWALGQEMPAIWDFYTQTLN